MKIIILDTETTGILQEDRICQLSYLVTDVQGNIQEVHNELCMPPLEIKFDAMAIHHITPEMILDKPECQSTKAFKRLHELNTQENLIVIQNAKFDLDMLAKEGFALNMQLIDTYRILRAVYPLDNPHSLQYKRYQWGLYKQEKEIVEKLGIEIKAHDALGDVVVLKNLFDRLLREQDLNKMIELCSNPILLDYMPMGKNKGKLIQELALSDRNNLIYMMDNFDLDQDVAYSLKHYLDATKGNIEVTIGFGKHKGKTPQEVATSDRDYLVWLRDKADNISSELKDEIVKILGDI